MGGGRKLCWRDTTSGRNGQALAVHARYLCKIWWGWWDKEPPPRAARGSIRDSGMRQGADPESRDSGFDAWHRPGMTPMRHFANRYAPPFSTLRWNAGRACIRDSHAPRSGYGPSLSNTFAM